MKVEEISAEEAEKEFANKRAVGKWAEIIKKVLNTGEPVKVSGLTRGQVAGAYRSAKDTGVKTRANYKDGYVVFAVE